MVSDQEIANGLETLLRQSGPNAVTTLNGVVEELGAKLGQDLSHKAAFIRDHINLLFRSHPKPQPPPQKDHFALQQQLQFHQQQQFPSHFALLHHHNQQRLLQQQQQRQRHMHDLNYSGSVSQSVQLQPPPPVRAHPPPPPVQSTMKEGVSAQTAATSAMSKESAPAGTKRRGGPGGLNKLCGVSPELEAVVGAPALARTEIVKQLWAYIRKHNLQDPSNKRKIICDEALRVLFETDCTDMFKMNKLLSKHIISLGPKKEPAKSKRLKVDVEAAIETVEPPGPLSVVISEALFNFFGTGEREMLQSEALGRVWEYIKVNHLEDPAMVILCDEKLQELLGCESISALGISEMLARHHLFNRSS